MYEAFDAVWPADKENPALEDEAREAFRKMELNDPEYLELWRWIREESLKESEQIYELLDVKFDSYNGEAFYNDKMDPIVDELEAKGLLVEDQGARIVDLGEDLPPAFPERIAQTFSPYLENNSLNSFIHTTDPAIVENTSYAIDNFMVSTEEAIANIKAVQESFADAMG